MEEELPSCLLFFAKEKEQNHFIEAVVQTSLLRLWSAAKIAKLTLQMLESQKGAPQEPSIEVERIFKRTMNLWQSPAVSIEMQSASKRPSLPSGYDQASPGMIVQFAIYGLLQAGTALLLEKQNKTLSRLLSTPLTRTQFIVAKICSIFIVIFTQILLLILIGQFAFRVNYLRAPLATLLVAFALALWAASLGLFLGTIARKQEQLTTWTLLAMFFFAALGGAWFPLEITGKTFAQIGHLLPSAWAMDGFQNIIVRGLGLESVLLPTIIILGYAFLFFGLAVWRLYDTLG